MFGLLAVSSLVARADETLAGPALVAPPCGHDVGVILDSSSNEPESACSETCWERERAESTHESLGSTFPTVLAGLGLSLAMASIVFVIRTPRRSKLLLMGLIGCCLLSSVPASYADVIPNPRRSIGGGYQYHLKWGNRLYHDRQYNQAEAHYGRVTQLNPRYAVGYYNRALALYQLKRFKEAAASLTEAIRLKPTNGKYYDKRGDAWRRAKQYQSAIEDYSQAIRYGWHQAETFENRAEMWVEQNQYKKAIVDYTSAISKSARDADLFHSRGHAWKEIGDLEKAIEDFTAAIKREPAESKHYGCRASVWSAKGDEDRAKADRKTAERLGS